MTPKQIYDELISVQTDVCPCAKRIAEIVREHLVWRSMETAPRDGTPVLVLTKYGGVASAKYLPLGNSTSAVPWMVAPLEWWADHILVGWLPLPPTPTQ